MGQVSPMTADCGYVVCSTNTCFISHSTTGSVSPKARIATVEYCYGFNDADLLRTICGCGQFS